MALPCLAPDWTRWLALNMFEPSSDPPIKKAFQLLPRGQEPQVGRQVIRYASWAASDQHGPLAVPLPAPTPRLQEV